LVSNWKVIFAAVLIFACGLVSGALLTNRHEKPVRVESLSVTNTPPPWQIQRVEFLRRIEKHLNLTPQQRERIEKIMHDSQERTKPLWDQISPQLRDELKQLREAIRAELTPEQQKTFEKLIKPRAPRRTEDEEKTRKSKPRAEAPIAQTNGVPTP
jgi:Spy/CpxP family protein refolding chaperone